MIIAGTILVLTQVQAEDNAGRLNAMLIWQFGHSCEDNNTISIQRYNDTARNYCLKAAEYLGIEKREEICEIVLARRCFNPWLL
jgi:hypothetical protein